MSVRNCLAAASVMLLALAGAAGAGAAGRGAPPTNLCLLHLHSQLAALHATGTCAPVSGTGDNGKIIGDQAVWHSSLGPGSAIQLNVTFGESQAKFYAEGENGGTSGGAPVKFGVGSRSESSPVDAQISAYAGGVGVWIRVTRQLSGGKTNAPLLGPMLALVKAVVSQV